MKLILSGRSQSRIGVGIGVDIFRSESELLEVRRLRSLDYDYCQVCHSVSNFHQKAIILSEDRIVSLVVSTSTHLPYMDRTGSKHLTGNITIAAD